MSREIGSREKNTIGWAKEWKRVGEGGSVWTIDRYLNLHVDGQLDRWINRESKYAPCEVVIQSVSFSKFGDEDQKSP